MKLGHIQATLQRSPVTASQKISVNKFFRGFHRDRKVTETQNLLTLTGGTHALMTLWLRVFMSGDSYLLLLRPAVLLVVVIVP